MTVGETQSETDTGQLPPASERLPAPLAEGSPVRFSMTVGADPSLFGRFRARGRRMLGGCFYDAVLRAAGRPSTFRTGLAM